MSVSALDRSVNLKGWDLVSGGLHLVVYAFKEFDTLGDFLERPVDLGCRWRELRVELEGSNQLWSFLAAIPDRIKVSQRQ